MRQFQIALHYFIETNKHLLDWDIEIGYEYSNESVFCVREMRRRRRRRRK